MLKPLLKKAIPLLTMIPLLGSCSLFQPKTKVIEYDEEVKLHDGSMIWVHIKRHYKLVGGAIGDPGWRESTYMPSAVEISWDTGFPNVGRKSVTSKSNDGSQIFSIDKVYDNWYIIASMGLNEPDYQKGIPIGETHTTVLFIINSEGKFLQPNNSDIPNLYRNIFYYYLGYQPGSTKITWNDKLQDTQNKSLLGKKLYP